MVSKILLKFRKSIENFIPFYKPLTWHKPSLPNISRLQASKSNVFTPKYSAKLIPFSILLEFQSISREEFEFKWYSTLNDFNFILHLLILRSHQAKIIRQPMDHLDVMHTYGVHHADKSSKMLQMMIEILVNCTKYVNQMFAVTHCISKNQFSIV